MRFEFTCHGCQRRQAGCHACCETYREEKVRHDAQKAEIKKQMEVFKNRRRDGNGRKSKRN